MKILSITAPYSESRYHYERIGRDGLLGSVAPVVKDLFIQNQNLGGDYNCSGLISKTPWLAFIDMDRLKLNDFIN